MRTSRTIFWFSPVLAALVLVFLAAGCGPRRSADRGVAAGVLHLGNSAEPADLDPQVVTGRPENRIITALIEGLVAYDPVDLHPVPGVAETWIQSPDGKTYTFRLRDDARWSNGDPVTAQDFVGSWKRMLTPSLASEYAYMLFHVEGAEDYYRGRETDFSRVGFRAPDARTIEVRLRQRTPFFLSLLNHYSWFPVHLPTVEKFGGLERKGSAWTRPENYVGNGPFVLKEWQPNQRITVAKSPTYWDREKVRLSEIMFYPVESDQVEERMFRTGQVHVTTTVPLSKIDAYRAENSPALQIHPYLATMFVRLNVRTPALSDPRVRRALALGIDRETLTREVLRGTKMPAYGMTPPMPGFPAANGFRGSVEEARRLLSEAGFSGGAGLPSIDALYPTSDNGRQIMEALQVMWRVNLGVNINVLNQEWKVFLSSMDAGDYQMGMMAWVGDIADPHNFLELFVTDGGNNRTFWSNARYDALLARSLDSADNAARMDVYREMEAVLAAEAPVIPVYFYNSVELVHPAVRGWNPTVLDVHPYKHVWLEK